MPYFTYFAELDDQVGVDELESAVSLSLETLYPDRVVETEETETPSYDLGLEMDGAEHLSYTFDPESGNIDAATVTYDDGERRTAHFDEPDTVMPGYQVSAYADDCTVHVSFSADRYDEQTAGYHTIVDIDEPRGVLDRLGAVTGMKQFPDQDEYRDMVGRLDDLEPEVSDRLGTDVERSGYGHYS